MSKNIGDNRKLNCAVIRYVHETRKRKGERPFDTIRCAFTEGHLLYEGSNFSSRLHIEVCVLNQDLIKGYFLPRPVKEYSPFL